MWATTLVSLFFIYVIAIAYKLQIFPYTCYIENFPIKDVTSAKYLGVTIDSKLTFNDHVQSITNKASQINAFIYRNLCQCPSTVKCNYYKSMVRPVLEYASTVWDPLYSYPYTSTNINKLQSVQRRAARFFVLTIFQTPPVLLTC